MGENGTDGASKERTRDGEKKEVIYASGRPHQSSRKYLEESFVRDSSRPRQIKRFISRPQFVCRAFSPTYLSQFRGEMFLLFLNVAPADLSHAFPAIIRRKFTKESV